VTCWYQSVNRSVIYLFRITDIAQCDNKNMNYMNCCLHVVVMLFEKTPHFVVHSSQHLYAIMSFSYVGAMLSSNYALQYISYPAQVCHPMLESSLFCCTLCLRCQLFFDVDFVMEFLLCNIWLSSDWVYSLINGENCSTNSYMQNLVSLFVLRLD